MLRTRHSWLAVMLAVGTVTAACKKDDNAESPLSKLADKVESAADDVSYLPVDSDVVMGVNFGQISQSALWKQYVDPMLKSQKSSGKLDKYEQIKAKCGMDPLTDIKTVSLGFKTAADKGGVIVVHGINKAKALACSETMKDEMTKDGDSMTRDGDILLAKDRRGDITGIAFPSDDTMVMVMGPAVTAAQVKTVLDGKSGLKGSPAFTDIYSKVKTSESLWFLVNGKSSMLDRAAQLGSRPKAVFGSLNVTDGLTLDARLKVDTPDLAASMATGLKGQAQGAATMVDKVDVTSEGDQVKIAVAISNEKLKALIGQFGPILGLGGMMGGQ